MCGNQAGWNGPNELGQMQRPVNNRPVNSRPEKNAGKNPGQNAGKNNVSNW
jgi:hypothetical protein